MLLELLGAAAAVVLVVTYSLKARSPWYVLGFAGACIGVALFAVATDAWLFAVLEGTWALNRSAPLAATSHLNMKETNQDDRHD